MAWFLKILNLEHEVATKLQKVSSFRTRRKLADCEVLIEQSWNRCLVVSNRDNMQRFRFCLFVGSWSSIYGIRV
ncbi:hypothetical protein L1987_24624 [Smallanthus sonchifolius]|uniref:Uncharacterized protein n=1 Tax=Smallanthus sonchifolius TaxID=185202 RepID=A0ACB9ILJ5_9ASTR|nr:hypothetical protein L1987_24624 [Smallanthus sonchifolius]